MQTSDLNREAKHRLREDGTDSAARMALASHPVVLKVLLSILGSGLIAIVGPVTWNTVAHVSFLSIQIVLELGRLGLAAIQIFGT